MKNYLLALLLSLSTFGLSAEITLTIGGNDFILNETTRTATFKIGTDPESTHVIIPEKVYYNDIEYTVTEIAKSSNQKVTEITIPGTVKALQTDQFYGMTNLAAVNMSEGLVSIGKRAFYRTAIKSIKFPESVQTLGEDLFYHTNPTTDEGRVYELPSNITNISESSILPCSQLIIKSIKTPFYKSWTHYNASVTFFSKTPPRIAGTLSSMAGLTLIVPKGCKKFYENTNHYNRAKEIIEMGSEEVSLSISQGDYGSVTLFVEKGYQHPITLQCGEQWKIASVLFNDTDITSSLTGNTLTTPMITDDTNTLNVVYEALPASIEDVTDSDSQVTVNTAGGQINVCGAAAGTPISVYDIRGMVRVPQFEATNATETIEVANGEVLLVRVGSRTFKVML